MSKSDLLLAAMFQSFGKTRTRLIRDLSRAGYRPAQAAQALEDGKYGRASEICKALLSEEPRSVPGRLVYGLALGRAGLWPSATEQFRQVLSVEPENLAALKFLGDALFAQGDEVAALAAYDRVLQLDPHCRGLKSDLPPGPRPAKSVTLTRPAEPAMSEIEPTEAKWNIHFYTETFGDLYLAQGHPRQAAEVYRVLFQRNRAPHLAEKLAHAEQKIKEREH